MQFGSDEHDVGDIARMQVRQWLMARTDLFRFEVAPLLVRLHELALVGLHELAAQVDVEAFDVANRKRIGGEQTLPTILELIAEIAEPSAGDLLALRRTSSINPYKKLCSIASG